VPPHNQDPGILAWTVAAVSLALPWIGIGLCLAGGVSLARAERAGWWLLIAGIMTIIADIIIDFVWAHPSVSTSDQPELNQRAAQLIGRVLIVEEAIESGRGKVRVGDTLWQAEGADMPRGTDVRVVATKSTILLVERMRG
jgi:inner membrane protein